MLRRALPLSLLTTGTVAMLWLFSGQSAAAINAPSDEQTLFSLTNQDRTSNGVAAIGWNGTLGGIARANPNSSVCGFTVAGRSQDMVNRNYFSHYICGSHLVFDILNADRIGYQTAGENIGWTSAPESSSADTINTAFMNSTDHRANILNSLFSQMGIGAAGGTSADSCCGGSAEVMYTEIFIQPSGGAPPPPKPSPKPTPRPTRAPPPPPPPPPNPNPNPVPQPQPTRNSPAPPAPSVPPANEETPNAVEASPSPSAAPNGVELQPARSKPGLLELIVNSILQAFLNF